MNVGRVWEFPFLKEYFLGGLMGGCDEGAEVSDHKEWSQNYQYPVP